MYYKLILSILLFKNKNIVYNVNLRFSTFKLNVQRHCTGNNYILEILMVFLNELCIFPYYMFTCNIITNLKTSQPELIFIKLQKQTIASVRNFRSEIKHMAFHSYDIYSSNE